MRSVAIIFCAILIFFSFSEVQATIIYVPADSATIQAGINGAVDGDTVMLADGTYIGQGNRNINYHGKQILVVSGSGNPQACIINCQGEARGFRFHSGEGISSILEGMTIKNGWAYEGGGIECSNSAPLIKNCILKENSALNGGGMHCWECDPRLVNCIFSENSAQESGGGMFCNWGSPNLTDCAFYDNSAGGMFCYWRSDPHLNGCLFSGNSPNGVACLSASFPRLSNCTFFDESGGPGGVIDCGWYSSPTLENTIIAFSTSGVAVDCDETSEADLTCCDVYGNAGGDWVGCIMEQYGYYGNISQDPLFCGQENPDEPLTLTAISPCAAENNPECGRIGALGVGCLGYVVGDVNQDGIIDIEDVTYLISYLYTNGSAPNPLQAGECNCDGIVDLGDVVYLINYLLRGGPPPCEP